MKTKTVYVPVVTKSQLQRMDRLARVLGELREVFEECFLDLESSLNVLRGENHPEGWATVKVVPDHTVKSVLVVEHYQGSRSDEAVIEAAERMPES